jgi:two-component system chemotaxis response regulator CheB
MPPIRILIVDDSAIIRKVLSEGLAVDPALEVIGTAPNGQIALSKIPLLHPDIITLDVEMPVMNGLETLVEIRKAYPKLPVIMFSTLTESGASTTLDALALGASDYATKPTNTGSLDGTLVQIREQLIPKIKALCSRRQTASLPTATSRAVVARPSTHSTKPTKIDLLAIGTSTGGPNALGELIPRLPGDLPVPVVIVQHMPRLFTRLLSNRLNDVSPLKVQEGMAGAILNPGEVWIAPGDFHMTVERKGTSFRLALNQDAPENSCRPAVDPLFRSVASSFGPAVLAVVLTGMGSDGVVGARHIRENGGQVIVQDEASCVVWGMPGQVVAAGLADAIYPLDSMARAITQRIGLRRHSSSDINQRAVAADLFNSKVLRR